MDGNPNTCDIPVRSHTAWLPHPSQHPLGWESPLLPALGAARDASVSHQYIPQATFFVVFFKIRPGTSLVAQMVTNLPAMQETRLQSLGQDDPLQMGIATQSSILVERILWTEEPGGLQSRGHKESDTTEPTITFTFTLGAI